jgi:hypothetical protein
MLDYETKQIGFLDWSIAAVEHFEVANPKKGK